MGCGPVTGRLCSRVSSKSLESKQTEKQRTKSRKRMDCVAFPQDGVHKATARLAPPSVSTA
jgi:hypothetical protein